MAETADKIVETGLFEADSEQMRAANVNQQTGLATDYLNHFNEPIMLVQMLAEMPEFVEDIRGWQAKSYAEHFQTSGLKYAGFIVAAYDHAPPHIIESFENVTQTLTDFILSVPESYSALLEAGNTDAAAEYLVQTTQSLNQLADMAAAIVNGDTERVSQDAIDQILQN